jgi:hypothetical protein
MNERVAAGRRLDGLHPCLGFWLPGRNCVRYEEMSEAQTTCIYCGAQAARWCALIIGFTDPDGDGLCSGDGSHELLRCDAALCEAHADFQGNVFYCGTPRVSGVESIDHCCGHREDGWEQAVDGSWIRNPDRFAPITEEEAARVRYRHRCKSHGLKLLQRAPAPHSNPQVEGE